MGFYIRKSVRVGPLRFNLSKSGIGVSAGIKGLRIGSGPSGIYVHAGANGFYYRKNISQRVTKKDSQEAITSKQAETVKTTNFKSDISRINIDSSHDELVSEMDRRMKRWSLWKLSAFTILPALVYLDPRLTLAYIPIGLFLYFVDLNRRTVVVMYDFDEERLEAYKSVVDGFEGFLDVQKVWSIPTSSAVTDRKRNAGADHLVERKNCKLYLKPPSFIRANIPVPTVKCGSLYVCFFPDKLLVFEPDLVGAVNLSNVSINIGSTTFIEESGVPYDARVVGSTWKYVNKKGGPDKRFANNFEIPVVEYETIRLKSSSGLNELLYASKIGGFKKFYEPLEEFSKLEKAA